jgi:hypothetical protein
MEIRAQECHAMAFDSTNCHSSGILHSRMPQLWHFALKNATALAFCAEEYHSRGIPSIKLSSMAFDVSRLPKGGIL